MALTLTSLAGVTSTGLGSVLSLDKPRSVASMQVMCTAGNFACTLQGSLDGTHFFDLPSGGQTYNGAGAIQPTAMLNFNGIVGAWNCPVLYLAADLTSLPVGQTLTAIIAVAE